MPPELASCIAECQKLLSTERAQSMQMAGMDVETMAPSKCSDAEIITVKKALLTLENVLEDVDLKQSKPGEAMPGREFPGRKIFDILRLCQLGSHPRLCLECVSCAGCAVLVRRYEHFKGSTGDNGIENVLERLIEVPLPHACLSRLCLLC